MFSSEHRVGRLVELRVTTPFTTAEMEALERLHLEVIESVPDRYVIAADFRRAQVFPAAITDQFIHMMSRLNTDLIRSAILVNASAVFGLQAERAIREAGDPDRRRAFRLAAEMQSWLGEVLDNAERLRLREFLLAGDLAAAPASRQAPDGGFRPVAFEPDDTGD